MAGNEGYNRLVSLLRERVLTKKQADLELIVKKIPDSDATGELDPRVFLILSEQARAEDANEPLPDNSQMEMENFSIEAFRAMMGWPNSDLTCSEIQTSYRQIPGTKGSIPLHIYSPKTDIGLPAILFFHGGGFVGGTVDTVENPCKLLAEKAGAVVITVDYRLAPEHPFPAGLIDCYDAVKWVHQHAREINANPNQIAVSGDSAGGNLAAVCAMLDKDSGAGIIKYQALIYPTVNLAQAVTEDFRWDIEQYQINNHHDLIHMGIDAIAHSASLLDKLYLQNRTEATNPHVSPLLADDLSGLPESLIITAEFDFLRLEGEAYARKLARSGVRTTLIQYNGMDHAFIDKLGLYPQAEDCMHEIALGVRRRFS